MVYSQMSVVDMLFPAGNHRGRRAQMTPQSTGRRLLLVWLSSLIAASQAQDIDVTGCGKSKGCFRSPDGCEAANCKFLLTWNAPGGGNNVFFEMTAPVDSRNSWVAFGLSKDANMVRFALLCGHFQGPD